MAVVIAGIGSRETPQEICEEMVLIGAAVADAGGWVRSGHAEGADYAFEQGAGRRCLVYLPFAGFNRKLPMLGRSILFTGESTEWADRMVEQFHPNAKGLRGRAWAFHRRNAAQVLGRRGDRPVDFVVCWTREGRKLGGTAQALRIAEHYEIPVLNMFFEEWSSAWKVLSAVLKLM